MEPVAEVTISAEFSPNSASPPKHRVAVLAYDGVVLGDLATPLEIFGRVRDLDGRSCYDVRVCGANEEVKSEHLVLRVPWRLSSVARADTIIVPGVDHLERIIPPATSRALRSA
jgi:putative intracellular protease/amidase